MDYRIIRIDEKNYPFFDDMIYWRETGQERAPAHAPVPQTVGQELQNPNLFVYALETEGRYVGWISLVYIPKVGKWNGRGHVYVDELWVAPEYRGRGYARALMQKADELKDTLQAAGIRLYVNTQNETAHALYSRCGCREDGTAHFMEK